MEKALVTPDYEYHADFAESDINSSVKMYDRIGNLISNNYFAWESFMDELEAIKEGNMIAEYMCADVEYQIENM